MIVVVGDQPVAVAVDAALRARGEEVVKIGERELSSSDASLPAPLTALFLGIPPAPPATQLAELGIADFDEAIEAGLIARFGVLSDALPLLAAQARQSADRSRNRLGRRRTRRRSRSGACPQRSSASRVRRHSSMRPTGSGSMPSSRRPPVAGWPASADPEDIAKLALTLLEPGAGGATGALVACDGGVDVGRPIPTRYPRCRRALRARSAS